MEKEYDTQYKGKFSFGDLLYSTPSQGLRKDILNDTQFTQNEKAKKLIDQKGYLSDIQETRYAIQGLGTDDDKMKEVTKGKSSKDMQDLRDRWAEDPENKALGIKEDLNTFILGDYSGREKEDMELTLKYGDEPDNPEDQLKKAKELQTYEKDALMSHIIAGRELDVMDQDVTNLEKEVKTFQTYATKKDDKDFDWKKYAELKGNLDSQMTIVDSSVSVHRQ